jgi:uncharacterized protein YjbI with pentapeptide repeats
MRRHPDRFWQPPRSRSRGIRSGFRDKTVWDWLQLLLVPLVLAVIAIGFNFLQSDREQEREDARQLRELAIARAARNEEARSGALTDYLQQMSDLTLEHRLTSHPSKDVALLARNLTLTALRRLDGQRKAQVIQFLADAGLLRGVHKPIISLYHADLRNLSLRTGELGIFGLEKDAWTSLVGADLRHADFRGATLDGIRFDWADLRGADFTDAVLVFADYSYACLTNTSFRRALLQEADLSQAVGHDVDFTKATLEVTAKNHRLQRLKQDGIRGQPLRPFTPASPPVSPKEQDDQCDTDTG